MKYDTILFDLDGTLLYTLEDLADSINYMLIKYGFEPHTIDEVRRFVGNGLRKLVERALPEGAAYEHFEEFLKECKKRDYIEGVIYWEPLWIPGDNICWASVEGQAYIHEEGKSTRNEWSNQCLFDYQGNMLPGFNKFKL